MEVIAKNDENNPFQVHVTWDSPAAKPLYFKAVISKKRKKTGVMKVVDSKQIEQTSCTFDNLKPERVYTCQVISHYEKNDKESEQVEIQTSPGN